MADMNPTNGVRIHCSAKLNLTLAVAPPRDDGLHPIASVMVALDFGDTLNLHPLDAGPCRLDRAWHDDAPHRQPIDWPIERDLIYRAHALLEQEIGHALPIECRLLKRIPAGAGLGGGSSNAAGMLIGLREAFGLPVTDERLIELGQSLGADVGFAVHTQLGKHAALVTGIGEVIEPLPTLAGADLVLIFPEGICPTAQVYAAFDAGAGGQKPTDTEALAELAARWRTNETPPDPMNDLSLAAAQVCPAIGSAIASLKQLGHNAFVTGSGSALFVLAESADVAKQIAQSAEQAGLTAAPTAFGQI